MLKGILTILHSTWRMQHDRATRPTGAFLNVREVLAIIGVCKMLILPVIGLSLKARLATAAVFSVGQVP